MGDIQEGDWIKVTNFDHNMSFTSGKMVDISDIESGIFKITEIFLRDTYPYYVFKTIYEKDNKSIDISFFEGEVIKAELNDLWNNFCNGKYISWTK